VGLSGYAMSRENVEIPRRAADVFSAGDLDRYCSEFIAPDVEWGTSGGIRQQTTPTPP